MIYLQYIDDSLISNRGISDIQSGYQVPIWMWGQKEASQKVTDQSSLAAERYAVALKHEIAGLVRNALWNIRITENRRDLAQKILTVADELLRVVQRRLELGDMSKSDMLLAESDALEKKSLLMQAEAEVIHANKAYQSLTRSRLMPGRFEEQMARDLSLNDSHPALAAATASVERAQAEVDFVKLSKQGNQPTVLIGTDSTSVSRQRDYGTGTNLVFQIPIGGDDWHAPQVAQANILLNEKLAQREALHRQLEKAAHEAEHILDLDQKALVVASRRKEIAEEQLRMSKIALENGEISMIDYLKIQTTAQTALKEAAERKILVLKDISILHQAVGISP
jgi:outer membrane protein TolC